MLEVKCLNSFFSLHFTIFPRTVVFLQDFERKVHKALVEFFLKSKVAKNFAFNPNLDFLNPKITLEQNLNLLSKFVKRENIASLILKYFNLDSSILNLLPSMLTEEEKTIISISYFLFTDANIWLFRLNDSILQSPSKEKIEKMITSKISNSESIVFYSTHSGLCLDLENQIIIR